MRRPATIDDLPEAIAADAHIVEHLIEISLGHFVVVAPDERYAFLAVDFAIANLLGGVVGGSADAELDIRRVVVQRIDPVVDEPAAPAGRDGYRAPWRADRAGEPRLRRQCRGRLIGHPAGLSDAVDGLVHDAQPDPGRDDGELRGRGNRAQGAFTGAARRARQLAMSGGARAKCREAESRDSSCISRERRTLRRAPL